MDVFIAIVAAILVVVVINRLLRWALDEDRRAGGKTLINELEQWMQSKHGNREQ